MSNILAEKHRVLFPPKKYKLIYSTCSFKKFNIKARVDLNVHQTLFKVKLKILS